MLSGELGTSGQEPRTGSEGGEDTKKPPRAGNLTMRFPGKTAYVESDSGLSGSATAADTHPREVHTPTAGQRGVDAHVATCGRRRNLSSFPVEMTVMRPTLQGRPRDQAWITTIPTTSPVIQITHFSHLTDRQTLDMLGPC